MAFRILGMSTKLRLKVKLPVRRHAVGGGKPAAYLKMCSQDVASENFDDVSESDAEEEANGQDMAGESEYWNEEGQAKDGRPKTFKYM